MNRAWKTWGDLVSMEYDFHSPVIFRILEKLSGNPYTVYLIHMKNINIF